MKRHIATRSFAVRETAEGSEDVPVEAEAEAIHDSKSQVLGELRRVLGPRYGLESLETVICGRRNGHRLYVVTGVGAAPDEDESPTAVVRSPRVVVSIRPGGGR